MSLIVCPECGKENVSSSAFFCPNCGFPISQYYETDKDNIKNPLEDNPSLSERYAAAMPGEQSALSANHISSGFKKTRTAKRIAIVIAAGIIIWSVWFFSTRCAYDGCMEHKSSSDRYCSYHRSQLNSYKSTYNSPSHKSSSALVISDVNVNINSVASYCTGTIKNTGGSTYRFIKLKGSFKDRYGNVVETGNTYGASGEGLAPGESTSFTIYCSRNSDIWSCDVTVYDYD